MEGEVYTVGEAARILRTTERTERRRLERGDLEGTRDSYTRSCITPPVSGRRMPHSPARIPMKLLEGMGVPRGIMC